MANMQTRNKEAAKKAQVYAFGFDKLSMHFPDFDGDEFTLQYVPYSGSPLKFDHCDGLIVPSGIFEQRKSNSTFVPDRHRLVECEKQIFQSMKKKAWTCFLLTRIDNGRGSEFADTDLAKKFVNYLFEFVSRDPEAPNPHIKCRMDEFAEFFRRFGIAETGMTGLKRASETRILASSFDGKIIHAPNPVAEYSFCRLRI